MLLSPRHVTSIEYITYNDLQPNDLIWEQGNLWHITAVTGHKHPDKNADGSIDIVICASANAMQGYNYFKGHHSNAIQCRQQERATIVRRDIRHLFI